MLQPGERLAILIDEAGFNQRRLSALTGYSQSTVSRHTRGETHIGPAEIARYAKALSIDPHELKRRLFSPKLADPIGVRAGPPDDEQSQRFAQAPTTELVVEGDSMTPYLHAGDRLILRAAVKVEILDRNPFAHESGANPPLDQDWPYIDAKATQKLLEACETEGEKMVIALCRYAGLRRGEALRLTWQDVDLDRRRLTVAHAGVRTTKRRARVVPICPELAAMLNRQGMLDSSPVVAGLSASSSGYRRTRELFRRAGMPDVGTHTLRKSRATEWIEDGHDPYAVAKWLGHSVTVAQQHYHRATDAQMDRAAGVTKASDEKPRKSKWRRENKA